MHPLSLVSLCGMCAIETDDDVDVEVEVINLYLLRLSFTNGLFFMGHEPVILMANEIQNSFFVLFACKPEQRAVCTKHCVMKKKHVKSKRRQ